MIEPNKGFEPTVKLTPAEVEQLRQEWESSQSMTTRPISFPAWIHLRYEGKVHMVMPIYTWPHDTPEPRRWTHADGTIVYRSYADYCMD